MECPICGGSWFIPCLGDWLECGYCGTILDFEGNIIKVGDRKKEDEE